MTQAYNFRTDPSFWILASSNIFSIILALVQKWDIGEIMWIYWAQSIVIGLAAGLRCLSVKSLKTSESRDLYALQPVANWEKLFTVCFFFLHYGLFHYFYFLFIHVKKPLAGIPPEDLKWILMGIAGFVATHIFSLAYNITRDFEQTGADMNKILGMPYRRIMPMHLTIILGAFMPSFALLVFMALKAWVDAGAHMAEHKSFRAGPA